jgi:hypothetical protein
MNETQNSYRLLSLENKWRIINCFSVSFHEDKMKRLYEYAPNRETTPPDVDEKTQAPPDTPVSAAKPNERPKRIRRPYDEWRKETVPYTALSTKVARFEPTTFNEAINCDDSKESMQRK